MFVRYAPDGSEPQFLEFKPGRVKLSQQAIIERQYKDLAGEKISFVGIVEELRVGSAIAVRVVLHHCLRLIHPTIKLADVDPAGDEVEVLAHKAELQEMLDKFEAAPDFPNKDVLIALTKAQMRTAPDADPDDVEPGKADGSNSSTKIGGSAPAPSRKRGRSAS